MMHYSKNESKTQILKIPIVWVKISKTSILDHMYMKKEFESDTPNVDFSSLSKKVSPPAIRIFGEETK